MTRYAGLIESLGMLMFLKNTGPVVMHHMRILDIVKQSPRRRRTAFSVWQAVHQLG